MTRVGTILTTLVAALSLAFAGCAGGPAENGDDGHDITSESFRLTVSGAPTHVESGERVMFAVTVESVAGSGATTTHFGAHYWDQSTDDPDGDFGLAGGCSHVQGATEVPGSLEVTCENLSDGTHFFRGHLRLQQGDELLNFWSEEFAIHVGPM